MIRFKKVDLATILEWARAAGERASVEGGYVVLDAADAHYVGIERRARVVIHHDGVEVVVRYLACGGEGTFRIHLEPPRAARAIRSARIEPRALVAVMLVRAIRNEQAHRS